MQILLVILSIFISPLAVFIHEKISTQFWINLVLFIVCNGGGFYSGSWFIGLIPVAHALWVIFAKK